MPTKQSTTEKPVRPTSRLKTGSPGVPTKRKTARAASPAEASSELERPTFATTVDHADREKMIREMAYYLSEKDGFPQGREQEYWDRAEKQIEDLLKS